MSRRPPATALADHVAQVLALRGDHLGQVTAPTTTDLARLQRTGRI